MHRYLSVSTVALAGLLAGASDSAHAQHVAVDATVRVSPHVVVGVRYGYPHAAPAYAYPVPRRRVIRRVVVDHRALERGHRHWHAHAAHGHDHLHHDMAHGYVSAREHAAWHGRMAHAHHDLHHDLDHRHDRAHKSGRGPGR